MTIIVYRKKKIFGKEQMVPVYLPIGTVPTPQRQEAAKNLDISIKKAVTDINNEYVKKAKDLGSQIEKWRWLGIKIAELISSLNNLEKSDIENNSIWPAISQYLHEDLMRGLDAKRSGTAKDHLRKVWLLAVLPDTDWFNTWTGWDAFIDRGEPLVRDPRILKSLKKTFPRDLYNLGKDDYQNIARILVETLSSRKGNAVNFEMFTDAEIQKAADQVADKLKSLKNGISSDRK